MSDQEIELQELHAEKSAATAKAEAEKALAFRTQQYLKAVAAYNANLQTIEKARQAYDVSRQAVLWAEIQRLEREQKALIATLRAEQENLSEAYKKYVALQATTSEDDSVDVPTLMDNVMRAAFGIGFALSLALLFVPGCHGLAAANLDYGYTWNLGIDAPAGALAVHFSDEKSSIHNQAWDGAQYFSAAQLAIGTGLNLLNTVSGLGPLAFGALGSITFAACMWISTGQVAHKAYRAWRKSTDIDYFIEERKAAIKTEEKLLMDPSATPEQVIRSKKKIEVKEKQLEALECYKKNKDVELLDANEDTRRKMAIAQLLQKKEEEKFSQYRKEFGVWLGAAGVMTAIAVVTTIAVLTATTVVCPPAVVAVGVLVGLLKGAQIVHSIVDRDYSKEAVEAISVSEGKDKNTVKNELLAKAIQASAQKSEKDLPGGAFEVIKAALSTQDQEKLINEEARKSYTRTEYLQIKANNAKAAVTGIGNKIGSFFRSLPAGSKAALATAGSEAALATELYVTGGINMSAPGQ